MHNPLNPDGNPDSIQYASVELCIQLTKIGFPKTEKSYSTEDNINFIRGEGGEIVRPSIDEMIGVLPQCLYIDGGKILPDGNKIWDSHGLSIVCDGYYAGLDKSYKMFRVDYGKLVSKYGPLIDALMRIYIWIHENKHLLK